MSRAVETAYITDLVVDEWCAKRDGLHSYAETIQAQIAKMVEDSDAAHVSLSSADTIMVIDGTTLLRRMQAGYHYKKNPVESFEVSPCGRRGEKVSAYNWIRVTN